MWTRFGKLRAPLEADTSGRDAFTRTQRCALSASSATETALITKDNGEILAPNGRRSHARPLAA